MQTKLPFLQICIILGSANALNLSKLQAAIDQKAEQWNSSFSVGVYHRRTGAFGVAGGKNDRIRRTAMSISNRFPVGSVTKPYTVSAVMQAYEKGHLDIDASIARYVDPILIRENGTTMLKLWGGDQTCLKITARMLMSMRGGIQDYNDSWYRDTTIFEPSRDVTPYDLLHRLNKSFFCEPGTCGRYGAGGKSTSFSVPVRYGG